MSERNYYVICDSGCRFPAMTKEQTLAAIAQAVATGKIGNCDTGFITTVKTINGTPLKFFVGTQLEYDSLSASQKENLFAIITNDTSLEGIISTIDELREAQNNINNTFLKLTSGEFAVPEASHADYAEKAGGVNGVLKMVKWWSGSKKLNSDYVTLFEDVESFEGRVFEIYTRFNGIHKVYIADAVTSIEVALTKTLDLVIFVLPHNVYGHQIQASILGEIREDDNPVEIIAVYELV